MRRSKVNVFIHTSSELFILSRMSTDEKLRQIQQTTRELARQLADLDRQIEAALEVPGECVPPPPAPVPPEPPSRERPSN